MDLCRFLHLDGLNAQQLSEAETHYLQYKWALNMQLNGSQKRAPKMCHRKDRMPWRSEQLPLRLDEYPLDRSVQEQARLGTLPPQRLQNVADFEGMPPFL